MEQIFDAIKGVLEVLDWDLGIDLDALGAALAKIFAIEL